MKDYMVINTSNLVSVVKFESICYFKSDDCYTYIQLLDNSHFVICKSLSKIESEISSPTFIRVHGSYLVNKYLIKNIDKTLKVVNMNNEFKIPYTIKLKDLLTQL